MKCNSHIIYKSYGFLEVFIFGYTKLQKFINLILEIL